MPDLVNVTIKAKAWGDLRFEVLARALALADAHHALIRCARLWSWQAANYTPEAPTYVVSERVIDDAIGKAGAASAMVRSRLAEEQPDDHGNTVYRIKGTVGMIEWYSKNVAAAELGGNARKRIRSHKEKPSGIVVGSMFNPLQDPKDR